MKRSISKSILLQSLPDTQGISPVQYVKLALDGVPPLLNEQI